ncbi:hypothetical protein Q1695_015230 [Nippostrongylus brasiliensis]|nr:hypothetical protein Q1695_015230 [Nippostrongylus brasiliensis]
MAKEVERMWLLRTSCLLGGKESKCHFHVCAFQGRSKQERVALGSLTMPNEHLAAAGSGVLGWVSLRYFEIAYVLAIASMLIFAPKERDIQWVTILAMSCTQQPRS